MNSCRARPRPHRSCRRPRAPPTLSMEGLVGARLLGEESLQMWDLNKRLEAYLARVKFLEEENEGLRAEIRGAKSGPAAEPWRAKYEEELRALRAALERAFREKCSAELARDNLYEEVQHVKSRCQKEQAAREEAKRQLAAGKKELEEERRAQIWLKERAVQLEKEVGALLEVHEEEKAGLDRELAGFSLSLESLRCAPAAFQPLEVEDYSRRLAEIWRGAVETYKAEVAQLEGSLGQAKESLWKAAEDNQQSQLQLQHLDKELAALRARKELLEDNLARQWQEQRGEAEKFQVGRSRGQGELVGRGQEEKTPRRTGRGDSSAPQLQEPPRVGFWPQGGLQAPGAAAAPCRRCPDGVGEEKLCPAAAQLQAHSCETHRGKGGCGGGTGGGRGWKCQEWPRLAAGAAAPARGRVPLCSTFGMGKGASQPPAPKDASFPRRHRVVLSPPSSLSIPPPAAASLLNFCPAPLLAHLSPLQIPPHPPLQKPNAPGTPERC